MRCSLHTAGYIPVSRTHHVLHTQREDNTDEVFSSHSRLHSCLSHSPCATYTVQTDGGQHGGVDNHRRRTTRGRALHTEATFLSLAFTMYYMQCREKTACGRALRTDATFLSLAFTMCCIQCREKTTCRRALHTDATFLSLAFTMYYMQCREKTT